MLLGIASQPERLKYLRLIQGLDQVFFTYWVKSQPRTKPSGGGRKSN